MPSACPRCGASILPLPDLAHVASEAKKAHDTMRLAVPDKLVYGVRILADMLPCYAGTCERRVA